MDESIASSFASCLEAFEDLISTLAKPDGPVHDQISLDALKDELGRLKVWAGNIAAHKTGRSSLDFRLRDASPLRTRIIGLIRDMEGLLREAISIASGDPKPRDEDSSDTDSSEDWEDNSTKSDPVNKSASHLTTELQQGFLDIINIIDCLYKLSITIRNAAPHDRLVKAASVDTSFYETWDVQHMRNKFPAAKESLIVRLGKANSKRRQYLKYQEKHHKKFAQDAKLPQNPALVQKPRPADFKSELFVFPGRGAIEGERGSVKLPKVEIEPLS